MKSIIWHFFLRVHWCITIPVLTFGLLWFDHFVTLLVIKRWHWEVSVPVPVAMLAVGVAIILSVITSAMLLAGVIVGILNVAEWFYNQWQEAKKEARNN